MIDEFLKQVMAKLNQVMKVYYEEAPNSATFPFGVVPTLSISPLDYGFNCIFDVELYVNELSDSDVEELCDSLRVALDGYYYKNSKVGFHVGFESQLLTKSNEQDLIMRRVSFVARIF